MSSLPSSPLIPPSTLAQRSIAVIGAGMAGIVCARTLMQAGHRVTVFEKSRGAGGRMSTRQTEWGSFDHGAQYFTVRDPRFAQALATAPDQVRRWSTNTVRILDPLGRVVAAGMPEREAHWVATPAMNSLVQYWAQPLTDAGQLLLHTKVVQLTRNSEQPAQWQVHSQQTQGEKIHNQVHSGFDAVVLALPCPQVQALLQHSAQSQTLLEALAPVRTAPCWTLMLAFAPALQVCPAPIGPHWNAARSTHHRIAWLARESSKPQRSATERWTVHASPDWSTQHLEDDEERVSAKLLKAFTEITGIRTPPSHMAAHRWRYAQTVAPLGQAYVWNSATQLGACGDWCVGHRVEDAFISGLEMALALV